MAAASTKDRELQLLDSVEFKILAVANKEEKLRQLLERYLPAVLLKAGSEHAQVRAKVVQIFARLKPFIHPPQVVLPVGALLDQYKSTDSPLIKQLDLSGIQHSLERIDDDDRRDLIPKALKGFAKEEGQSRASAFFQIILRLLLDVRIPPRGSKEDEEFRNTIGLSDEADAKYLTKMISLFFRLRTPTGAQTWTEANPTLSQQELSLVSGESPESQKIYHRMSELKTKLVVLFASGAFTDEEKFLPAVYAASSYDNRVSSSAEEILKRTSVSMETEDLIKRLFYAHSVLPATYRTRILNMLSKSALSTTMSDQILAAVTLDFKDAKTGLASDHPLSPTSTLERTKLHRALFQYLSWVARIGPSKEGFTIAAPLIKSMREYIQDQGWPKPESTSEDDVSFRSKAYETIGVLSRNVDLSDEGKLDLASWLFQSLSEDPANDAVVNIDGALSSLTAALPPTVGSEAQGLKAMLLRYMDLPDEAPAMRSTRHAVVKWANQCLEFSDITGRWIDILAIAGRPDERNDVIEQGHKGLDPWTYFAHMDTSPSKPDWADMVLKLFGSLLGPETHTTVPPLPELKGLRHSVFENFEGPRLAAFPVALRYIKYMMFLTALEDFKVEPDWMQTLDARVKTDIKAREKILAYLHTIDSGYVVFYLKACLDGAAVEDSPIMEECIRCFVDVASLSPGGALGFLTQFSNNLLPLIKSNNKEIRSLGARALGILASHLANDADSVENCCKTLVSLFEKAETAVGSDLNAAEGAMLAFSHLCSRCVYYGQPLPSDLRYPSGLLTAENVVPSLHDAGLESFSQLWTAGLAVPSRDGDQSLEVVVGKMAAQAKKSNEKAIFALGRLATGLEETEGDQTVPEDGDGWSHGVLGSILKELFSLHEIKRVEIQFTVGDAITAAVARWDSDYVKLTMDVESRSCHERNGSRSSRLAAVMNKLFADSKATKPSLLKASGIWLFCIVQYCSHLPEVQSRLREAQAAFMRLLSARDELVQETASRGLSLVYERGDADLKSTLVKDLVSAFTGSGTQLKVDQETELFEPGALPTGEGNSITSYKDIVNLANEVGDQRLVYKFMSLAANAATWSTRSAFGRFGLSNILSESEIDPKLYPKLYRYRFDPNQNVQRSMDDIWKALVKDSANVIDTHFDAILEDLLKSILGREWRMREASCAAISDLIHGRPFPQFEKYYRDIWTAALKVLDDVKGSVREAALRLCMTLSNGLVRQLEEGTNGSASQAMMKEALPFLLSDKGVESSVQEVQVFATITVLKIAKQGGKSLRPFIADMVSQLLGLLSSIEPQQINYHYQRVGEDSRDEIDKLRSQMVNRSPISEAIENALRFIDANVMAELAPKLEAAIKTAIGMPTKIGCSRVLTTLFTRHTNDVKPVAGRFLQLMEKQTMDKNDEVSQAYARATAYMMRAVPEVAKQRFCERFVNMYFAADDESRRQKISDVIVALAKISPDHFSALETELLPFSYLGSHDTDEYTSKVFKEVWDQHAGSSRTVVRYVSEIVAMVERCLDTQQWALRHTGAFTVAAMVKDVASASEASGQISDANLRKIWPVFDKTLALKTFPGKEKLLEAYPDFVEKGEGLWKTDSKIAAQMKKVALREAKRNNEEYRVPAFRCLWKFARARHDLDLLSEISDIVTPHLEELTDEDKMDVDSKEDLVEKTARNGLEAIARGYSSTKMKTDSLAVLSNVLDILKPFLSSPKFATIKRQVWYESVRDLMDAATSPSAAANDDKGIAVTYLLSLDMDLVDVGTEPQRVMRAKSIAATLKAKARGVFGQAGPDVEQFKVMVNGALNGERSVEVQKVLKQILAELQ
ncbi:proteasome stabiliser-domain-containing protein [Dactylonectria estremocensis]|uniref:Proteasome stabiliser-domain-containing protein n=1 Tax=Dactylonectria estremocensis TaxID=1079267 RepID=A0A9P9F218_9HYPO|nr:proteasome stabiliser-domain-containing protein [Dactylonectria estremocensis]